MANCSVEGCGRETVARGLCHNHYKAARRAPGWTKANRDPQVLPQRCTVENCGREAVAKGLCEGHYKRQLRYGSVDTRPELGRRPFQGPCSVAGCGKIALNATGLCQMHARRLKRSGEVSKGPRMLSAADIGHIRANRNNLSAQQLADWFETRPSTVVAIWNGRNFGQRR